MPTINQAHISLAALRHNLSVIQQLRQRQQLLPQDNAQGLTHATVCSKILAVVKADAYGHGMLAVADALTATGDVDALAVVCMQEASDLREAGCDVPIVALAGFLDSVELAEMRAQHVTAVIHDPTQLARLQHTALGSLPRLSVWLKVDTGMHRLGFSIEEVPSALEKLRACEIVDTTSCVLLSHLANAAQPQHPLTLLQYQHVQQLAHALQLPFSIANSAALWDAQAAGQWGSWVRPGIALYGVSPLATTATASDLGLQAVMTLTSRVRAVKACAAGEVVGYGSCYRVPEDTYLATVGIGYADGYPREVNADAYVLICGKRCPLVGRVSMDLLTVDVKACLNDVEQASDLVGAQVTLWGEALAVEQVADFAATIPYTLLTALGPRVERVYVNAS